MGKEHQGSGTRHGSEFFKEERERGNWGLKIMSKMGWQEGQGLGKDGKGNTECLKAKKKTSLAGIGVVKDDQFSVTQKMYSNVLAKLQPIVAGSEVDAPVDKADEPAYNSEKAVTAFVAREGLYGRFRRAKDAKNYSSAHMAEILGRTQEHKATPTATTEFKTDIMSITSNVSMRDYFAKKLNETSKKVTKFQTASGSGFSLDFQADYYNQMMSRSVIGSKGLGFGIASNGFTSNHSDKVKQNNPKYQGFVQSEASLSLSMTSIDSSSKKKKKSKKTIETEVPSSSILTPSIPSTPSIVTQEKPKKEKRKKITNETETNGIISTEKPKEEKKKEKETKG